MVGLRLAGFALTLAALLAAPFIVRGRTADPNARSPAQPGARSGHSRLVVLTPHNEQIRHEFGRAFEDHCRKTLGRDVEVDWRAPGGTTEIRRLLEAQFIRAIKTGAIAPDGACPAGALPYDILFGGGAYEHEVVKRGVTAEVAGTTVSVPMSAPAPFTQAQLDEWFGPNTIGPGTIYDPDKHWLGSALTAFGIGFNRDALKRLNLPEPNSWRDLCDPRYAGWLAMTDPRQSGSVATTYDAILNAYGWDEGWRTLRAMSANARFFAASSLKSPTEISRGEAAAGPVLDFYGRYQMQALREGGSAARLGYIDPPGEVFIDSDPISILSGGPNPELAAIFVEFVLSETGQALWQFPRRSASSAASGPAPSPLLGPELHELHRMPARRMMYDRHAGAFLDKGLDPYGAVSMAPLRGWRFLIDKMMACFAMDIHDEMRAAWAALNAAYASGDAALAGEMETLFFAFPKHRLADGTELEFTPANFKAIRDEWRDAKREPEIRMEYTRFFREQYARVAALRPERASARASRFAQSVGH